MFELPGGVEELDLTEPDDGVDRAHRLGEGLGFEQLAALHACP